MPQDFLCPVRFTVYKGLFGLKVPPMEKERFKTSILAPSDFAELKAAHVVPSKGFSCCNVHLGRGSYRNSRRDRYFASLTAYSLEDPQT